MDFLRYDPYDFEDGEEEHHYQKKEKEEEDDWRPIRCHKCRSIGHSYSQCPSRSNSRRSSSSRRRQRRRERRTRNPYNKNQDDDDDDHHQRQQQQPYPSSQSPLADIDERPRISHSGVNSSSGSNNYQHQRSTNDYHHQQQQQQQAAVTTATSVSTPIYIYRDNLNPAFIPPVEKDVDESPSPSPPQQQRQQQQYYHHHHRQQQQPPPSSSPPQKEYQQKYRRRHQQQKPAYYESYKTSNGGIAVNNDYYYGGACCNPNDVGSVSYPQQQQQHHQQQHRQPVQSLSLSSSTDYHNQFGYLYTPNHLAVEDIRSLNTADHTFTYKGYYLSFGDDLQMYVTYGKPDDRTAPKWLLENVPNEDVKSNFRNILHILQNSNSNPE